jgi:riboflavin transporter
MKIFKSKNEKTVSLGLPLGITKALSVKAAIFLGLLATATIVPMFVHSQPITGPIVNATLFIAAAFLGTEAAIMVGLIPSVIALSFGLFPAILAPMIPFIMISNALMIVVFGLIQKKNYWLGVISASLLKFVFLFSTSSVVVGLLMKKEVATKVASIMSWPQLATALAGGIIAWLIVKTIKR